MKKRGHSRMITDANGGGPQGAHDMGPKQSKRHFTKHAQKLHYKNLPTRNPLRGGIRL